MTNIETQHAAHPVIRTITVKGSMIGIERARGKFERAGFDCRVVPVEFGERSCMMVTVESDRASEFNAIAREFKLSGRAREGHGR